VEFVTYGGTPNPNVTEYPFTPISPPLPATLDSRYNGAPGSGTDPALLRDASRFTIGPGNEYQSEEYEPIPEFQTTQAGGVFAAWSDPQNGSISNQSAYNGAVPWANTMDGGRLNNKISPYSNFVEAPDGTGFLSLEANGRLSLLAWDGSVTTVV